MEEKADRIYVTNFGEKQFCKGGCAMKIKFCFFLLLGLIWFVFGSDTISLGQGKKVTYGLSFDDIKEGTLPEGWKIDATNPGDLLATWKVVKDETAPSKPHVLSITEIYDKSGGVFNLFWTNKVSFKDGVLEVKVRANSGEEDQGGGLI